MKNPAMTEIYEITMREYNKVGLRSTRFMESWEYSVKKSHGHVVVQYSRSKLEKELADRNTVIELDKCKGDDMGIYLAEMLSYDEERNRAKLKLLGNSLPKNDIIVEGPPLCSKKFFQRFWRKYLGKFGDMETVLMK